MKIEELKKEFDKQFPEFKGIGAKYPMFENNPVRTHIWQFIERSVQQAVEEALKGKDLVLPIPYRVGVKTRKVLNINKNLNKSKQ